MNHCDQFKIFILIQPAFLTVHFILLERAADWWDTDCALLLAAVMRRLSLAPFTGDCLGREQKTILGMLGVLI